MKKILVASIFVIANLSLQAQDFYKHLVGTLGTSEVIMDINRNGNSVKGAYYYQKYGSPISLVGEIKNGTIILKEKTGTFEGKIVGTTFSGIWKGSGRAFNFKLTEDYSKSVQFQVYSFEESQKLYKDTKDSPTAKLKLSFLQATAFANKSALTQIQDYTNKTFFGAVAGTKPTEKIMGLRKTYFQEYLELYKSETKADVMNMVTNYSQEKTIDMYIMFNENPVLSLCVASYEYAGGAHGQFASIFHVLDLKTGKKVSITDIFAVGYEKSLPDILEAELRKELNIKGSLTTYGLFVDKLPITENFYVDKNNITFTYSTYEIAPYSAGEIVIVVPYAKIKKILKTNSPISEFYN